MDIKCGAGQPSAYSGQQVVKQTTRYTHNLINPYKTLLKMVVTSNKNMTMVVLAVVAAVSAVVINGQEDYDYGEDNGLPAGSNDILSAPYDESFSCEGK